MIVFSRHDAGFGNLLILLSDSRNVCNKIYRNVYEAFELSKCVDLVGYTITEEPGQHPPANILMNKKTIFEVHSKIRDFVRPTPYMKQKIEENVHLINGVTAAEGEGY